MNSNLRTRLIGLMCALACLVTHQNLAFADGDEELGPPSIPIADGSGVVAKGTGMVTQPGVIELDVPGNVVQALLYWEGFGDSSFGADADSEIVINGAIPVTGTLIGGPTFFFYDSGVPSNAYSSTYRADITDLDLIQAGANSISLSGMDFGYANNGAGLMVIYEDGSTTDIPIRDGNDVAFGGFPANETRHTTVTQTFTFEASPEDRNASMTMFFSSVQGVLSGEGPIRPTVIEVNTGGQTTYFDDLLNSVDGDEWDTLVIEFLVPAGATSLTIQARSEDRLILAGAPLPASFVWNAAALFLPGPDIDPASLGDFVWEDCNGNGLQDDDGIDPVTQMLACEGGAGIAGVIVELLAPGQDGTCNTGDEAFISSDTTDGNGNYLFDNLEPGDYCVRIMKPDGYECTVDNQGADDAVDSDFVQTGGAGNEMFCQTQDPGQNPISLQSGENDLDWDAGLIRPASLGDFVWEDADRNGSQIGEAGNGIEGVEVNLTDCNGAPVSDFDGVAVGSTSTDANGFYSFTNLLPGSYKVTFGGVDGYAFTTQDAGGDDASDSDANPANGMTACIELSSGEDDDTIDAGLFQVQGLGDFLWHDLNADGIQDAGEPGLEGYTVSLFGTPDCDPDSLLGTDTTDASGLYLFEDLPAGVYCVAFELPDICTLGVGEAKFSASGQTANDELDSDVDANGQTGAITLVAGQTDLSWDAGVYCPAKIGDLVWNDDDENGTQDIPPELGVDGVTVNLLDCSGNTLDTTTTSGGGMYMFTVMPGQYIVEFVSPSGSEFTTQGAGGSSDPLDSDANQVSGRTECLTVESDEYDDSWDAGLTPVPEDCVLGVEKTCQVQTPPSPGLEECNGKLQQFTLIWGGLGEITVGGIPNDAPGGVVKPGDTVTFSGPFASNDNFLQISGSQNGSSKFHVSCSDDDMDGETDDQAFPQDCGKAAGDGKKNESQFINDWILDGLVDKDGDTVDCSPDPLPPSSACEFQGTGADVTYTYVVENLGTPTVLNISVMDSELGAVAGSPIPSLTSGASETLTDSAFITETTTNTVTVTGATADGKQCSAMSSATVTVIPPPPADCDTDGKPMGLVFEYTGESCAFSDNDQGSKHKCTDSGDLSGLASFEYTGKAGSKIVFDPDSGVAVGDLVTLDASGAKNGLVDANSKFTITGSDGGQQVQEIHTSCSQPLNVGDQYGSLILREFIPRD